MVRQPARHLRWFRFVGLVLLVGSAPAGGVPAGAAPDSPANAGCRSGPAGGQTQPSKEQPGPVFLVLFDLGGPDAALSARLTDSLRQKLLRHLKRLGPKAPFALVPRIDVKDAWGGAAKLSPEAPRPRVQAMLARLAAQAAIWGSVQRTGRTVQVHLVGMDLSGRLPAADLDEQFRAEGPRAPGLIAAQVAERLTGTPVRKPREAGDVPVPEKFGAALTVNGSFERGSGEQPTGWQRIDGLTSFWVDDPTGTGRGKVIKMDTRVLQRQASEWWQRWRSGASAADAPEPIFATAPYYNSVGGLHGVHFYSDYYEVKPRKRYWVVAWMHGAGGKFFFPKVFVKGYAMVGPGPGESQPARREVWRTYIACRNPTRTWQRYCDEFVVPDTVKWVRIVLYAYWPVGIYYWDDVWIYEDPVKPSTSRNAKAAR